MLERFFTYPKRQILIIRKTLPSLRISTLKDMYEMLDLMNIRGLIREEKIALNWHCPFNGSLIHFGGLDDPQKIKCFHPETEIFTKEGWKSVTEITIGELVATINPQTDDVEMRPVSNTWIYDYNGKMITSLSGTGSGKSFISFCVTPNHKMLIESKKVPGWKFREAGELPKWSSTYHVKQAVKEWDIGDIIDFWEIPKVDFDSQKGGTKKKIWNGHKSTIFPIKPWLRFLGWYLSEGCCDTKGKTVRITQTKPEGRRQFLEDMEEFPYSVKEFSKEFQIYGKDLCAYLKQFGKCYNKFIPREILNLHPFLLKELFFALIAGDGTKTKNGWAYTTTSKQLADDVSELAIKLGYTCTICNFEPKHPPDRKHHTVWYLSIIVRKHAGIRRTSSIDYNGKVYGIEVPPYHTVLTRHDGRIMWMGQSTQFHDIWMEETTDFSYEDFVVLKTRLSAPPHEGVRNQLFFSFNPEDEQCWIKEKVIDGPEDCEEIFSSYRDNPFLDPDYMQELEKLLDQDINRYRIYALGEWGRLEDLIYNNWDVIKKMPDDEGSNIFYGVDFGYNQPSALVRVISKDRDLFLEEMLYETKLTNSDLAKKLRDLLPIGHRRNCKIYCDNAEPDRLEELKREGFKIIPARKGPNSVKDGIDFIKRRKLHILSTSANLLKEIRTYGWKKDPRDETRFIDEPVKFRDHLCDSLRYAVWTHLGGEGRPRIRVFD